MRGRYRRFARIRVREPIGEQSDDTQPFRSHIDPHHLRLRSNSMNDGRSKFIIVIACALAAISAGFVLLMRGH